MAVLSQTELGMETLGQTTQYLIKGAITPPLSLEWRTVSLPS